MARNKKPGRIKNALLDWLGVPITLRDSAFWKEWNGTSSSGKSVTVDKALQLSAVWACVRLVSETISTLPLKLYERVDDGSRAPATGHPLYQVLSVSPNAEMTPARFMLMLVASIVLRGNAFVEKKRVGARIVALVPLLPQCMVVKRLDNGRLEYTYSENGAQRVIAEKDLMHIRGFGLDGVCGLQPVQMGRDVLGAAMSADEAAAKIFAQGMQAAGILSSDKKLTDVQREKLRKSLSAFMGSTNAGKVMVAEDGFKYQGITMNPEAAQMLETRNFEIEEICRWFRVPPFMVGHMDKQSSWASSVEGMNLQWLTNGLRPMLENIEQEIGRCLLENNPRFFVKFSVEGLLRADSAGRAAWYSTGVQNAWMNRNEVRRFEDMPPIPGGDIYTVQSNLIPIDQLGKAQDSEQARSALAAWLFPNAKKDPKPE
ncbi:phage portal protein [Pseudomonas typographi]|uniref:Phage portal protein n=1 Tax=Pseudomonas typographi TaxID=2715964 RepID=A0ABR7Z785_9PSED|nr:phage portal protein [Pseudomonas typographi]MBD1601179.1 phage portal protein [Pseudomonas typographi]